MKGAPQLPPSLPLPPSLFLPLPPSLPPSKRKVRIEQKSTDRWPETEIQIERKKIREDERDDLREGGRERERERERARARE